MSRILFSVWFRIQGFIKKCPGNIYYSGLVQDSGYYSKMSRVLFSVWFSIQGIIQNTTSSVWFRIQRIIKKCPGYYSQSGSGFSVLLKNVQGIIQRMSQYSAYYSKMVRVLFSLVQDSAYN